MGILHGGQTMTSLFEPLEFRTRLFARNRIVLAPLTNMQSHADGSLGEDELRWLSSRAEGGFGTHICDVEVDVDLGIVRVIRYTAVQDVGRAIHPAYVEGQMQGGVAQGIGWALNEEYIYNKQGKVDNPGFLDYRMPVCSDLPMLDTIMVEVPNPNHPFGVKGVAEANIVPPMAAIANAIRNATGKRLTQLPMSPPKVLEAIEGGHEAR